MPGTSWLLSSVLAVILGAALAAPAGAATLHPWITTKTRLALRTTAGIRGTGMHVDTVRGQVPLYGTVCAAAEQAQAATVAQQISGVQGVRTLLQVVAPQDERAMQGADDALQERIEQALQADDALQDSRIYVQSVHQGMVLLAGTAQTLRAHLRAVAVVASVPGVWWIASAIQGPDTLIEAENWREPTPQQPRMAYGVGEVAGDLWITSATKMRLLADSQTPALDIQAPQRGGGCAHG